MTNNVYANQADELEQRRPLTPRFWKVRNEPHADEVRYADGWYWDDELCEEPMGPFDSKAEAQADHRELRPAPSGSGSA